MPIRTPESDTAMNQALKDKIEADSYRKNAEQFNVGDSVRVHTKVVEGDK